MPKLVILLVLLCSACTSAAQLATQRASREFDCPENQVKTTFLGFNGEAMAYKVEACGSSDVYLCNETTGECGAEP